MYGSGMELKFVEFVRLVSDGGEGGVCVVAMAMNPPELRDMVTVAYPYGHVVAENSPYTQNFTNIFDLPLIWNDATLSRMYVDRGRKYW